MHLASEPPRSQTPGQLFLIETTQGHMQLKNSLLAAATVATLSLAAFSIASPPVTPPAPTPAPAPAPAPGTEPKPEPKPTLAQDAPKPTAPPAPAPTPGTEPKPEPKPEPTLG